MLDYRMDTFLSLCETRSYTKTAERLHLTQPSVTQHIKYLERFYQCGLFRYDGRQVELTEAGEYLRNKMVILRTQDMEIRKRLYQMHAHLPFEIGFSPSAACSYALPKICACMQSNTEQRLQIHVMQTRQLLQELQDGALDVALTEGDVPQMVFEAVPLCTEQIIPTADPEIAQRLYGCSISQLLAYPLFLPTSGCGLRTLVQQHLSSYGISTYDFASVIEVDSLAVQRELLYQGKGIAFLFESTVHQDLKEQRIGRIYMDAMSMYGSFYLVYMRDRMEPLKVQELQAYLQ